MGVDRFVTRFLKLDESFTYSQRHTLQSQMLLALHQSLKCPTSCVLRYAYNFRVLAM